MKQKNYTKTKYPQLFKHTYWGYSDYEEQDMEIIANRNMIVEKFGLLKDDRNHSSSVMIGKDYFQLPHIMGFDHLEYYRIAGEKKRKFIMFTSDYTGCNMSVFGFEKTIPIYHKTAITWFRIFDEKREYFNFIKGIKR